MVNLATWLLIITSSMEVRNSAGVCAGSFRQPLRATLWIMRSYQMAAAARGDLAEFAGRLARRKSRDHRRAFATSASAIAANNPRKPHRRGCPAKFACVRLAAESMDPYFLIVNLRTRWNH